MNKEQLIERKIRTQRLLDDEIVQEALSELESGIIKKWKGCPVRDLDGQHELKLMLKLLEDFKKTLENYISFGSQAEVEIKREKKSIFR